MIQTIFSTPIFYKENIFSVEENKKFLRQSLFIKKKIKKGWTQFISPLYNTHNVYDLLQDINYIDLIKATSYYTNQFAIGLKSNYNYKVTSSWINFYNQKDFQEYHIHTDSVFSAVYTIQAKHKNDCYLTFENPSACVDMKPLKNKEYSPMIADNCKFDLPERSLIIFRSYLKHCVTQKIKKDVRISAAFNLN